MATKVLLNPAGVVLHFLTFSTDFPLLLLVLQSVMLYLISCKSSHFYNASQCFNIHFTGDCEIRRAFSLLLPSVSFVTGKGAAVIQRRINNIPTLARELEWQFLWAIFHPHICALCCNGKPCADLILTLLGVMLIEQIKLRSFSHHLGLVSGQARSPMWNGDETKIKLI